MSEPKRRHSFFLRPWFALPLLILFVLIGGGAWFGLEFVKKYEKKAAEFDLGKLDAVESASVVYDRYGQVFGKIFIQNREQVGLDLISPCLVDAVIAAEDNRFYEHSGVDFFGMFRALLKNTQAGRIRQGASTVTQQLAETYSIYGIARMTGKYLKSFSRCGSNGLYRRTRSWSYTLTACTLEEDSTEQRQPPRDTSGSQPRIFRLGSQRCWRRS